MSVGRVMFAAALAGTVGCGGDAPPPTASAGCRAGTTVEALRAAERTIEVHGVERTYRLDVPAGPGDVARPVLLVFHGAGGRRLRRWSGLGQMAHRRGVIAVYPEALREGDPLPRAGHQWKTDSADARDVAFTRALLDRLEQDWCIDPSRVWATGMSSGAAFVSRLGCDAADRIAGIAPVAGARVVEGCQPARPIPVLVIHGASDRVAPPEGARAARDWWVDFNGCRDPRDEAHCRHWETCRGGRVTHCEAGQGHVWPRPAGRRILDFFGVGAAQLDRRVQACARSSAVSTSCSSSTS